MCHQGLGHPGDDIALLSTNPAHNKLEVNKYPSVRGKGNQVEAYKHVSYYVHLMVFSRLG